MLFACVSVISPTQFLVLEPVFMKLYHDTWTHLHSVFHKSILSFHVSCVSVLAFLDKGFVKYTLLFVARQHLGNQVLAAMIMFAVDELFDVYVWLYVTSCHC
jgi:hypothetical protein